MLLQSDVNTPASLVHVDSPTGKWYLIYDTYAANDIFVCTLYRALVSRFLLRVNFKTKSFKLVRCREYYLNVKLVRYPFQVAIHSVDVRYKSWPATLVNSSVSISSRFLRLDAG